MNNPVPLNRQPWRVALVATLVAIQIAVAFVMLAGPRPSPYGWQMYSAAPPMPEAFALLGDRAERIDVESWLAHGRIEVDRAAVLREHGCERTGADAIRIELPDGTVEEIACR